MAGCVPIASLEERGRAKDVTTTERDGGRRMEGGEKGNINEK
jgi:hypothetical protein